jgi:hypothetical protein
MKDDIEFKLDKISNIWNHFIWKYRHCSSKIKFNDDIQTNYFGDILGYFQDTLDIVFKTNKLSDKYNQRFSHTISFLQAIYIQQDFVEEMLDIFKTAVDKGHLKKDPSYFLNRDLRNELIGHPIRKIEGRLISSTLFSYQAQENEIQYSRYHADNNFSFEVKTYSIHDIKQRHKEFLEKYFDIILLRLKVILDDFLTELKKLENVVNKRDFVTVLKLTDLYFEDIFNSDYVYDKESLIKIYGRKDEHLRYQNLISRFYKDLKSAINDTKRQIESMYEHEKNKNLKISNSQLLNTKLIFSDTSTLDTSNRELKKTYHYEIGKIATKRNVIDFNFFAGLLRSKCERNELVLNELKHMEENIYNEIEYYTSLMLICTELNGE